MTSDKEWSLWVCPKCGHEVIARERPQPIKWTDGHVCYFVPGKEEDDG